MNEFIMFVTENYVWILVVIALIIITIIVIINSISEKAHFVPHLKPLIDIIFLVFCMFKSLLT